MANTARGLPGASGCPRWAPTFFSNSPSRGAASCFVALLAFGVLSPGTARADAGEAAARAESAIVEVEAESRQLKPIPAGTTQYQPARMVAEAELYLRSGQPDEAVLVLSRVVELARQGRAPRSSEADAEFLLGEAYFQTGELYSARRQYEIVTDRAADPAFASMGARAASRLVDVALQIQRTESLPDVLGRVERLSGGAPSEALTYARAKVLFAMGRYEEARSAADSIQSKSTYAQRAAYLRGVALMKLAQAALPAEKAEGAVADYRAAIAAFEQSSVSTTDEESADSKRISELSWLAIARLHFEQGRFLRAARAYEKVPRTSEHFARALFELSWTYVRMGDYERGGRTLDVLRVLDPGLIDGADAALLRADLLLRSGRYAEAEKAYEQARSVYEPLRAQITDYLKLNTDPAIYYDKLTDAVIPTGGELPPMVIAWAREEAREDRVFAIVDDVARSRAMIKDSRRRIGLVRAVLSSSASAKAFPEVRRQLEVVVGLLNKLSAARLDVARGLDEESGTPTASLGKTREERRSLMARLSEAPVDPADFSVRDVDSERKWNAVSQGLQRLELEADHLQALINGLRAVLRDADRHGVVVDAASAERYRAELLENERDMAVYRARIQEYREQLDLGRVASGFGDERYVEDENLRVRFRDILTLEVAATAAGEDPKAQGFAQATKATLARILPLESRLEEARKSLDALVASRGEELARAVAVESEAIEGYASRLDTLDQHARVLVGEVARDNFERVRNRLKDVVLRADVGIVQKAWEIREEQRHRVQDLQRERAREETFINDELREVLDDSEDSQ